MPFITTPKTTLFCTEVGRPDAPAILFSNSLGTTHRMWDAIVEELAADFRCIRYDTRGHGASTVANGPFEIEDLADDVVAILDNLGLEKVHFAGLSLGGMTGQALAIRHPARLHSLTLMATTAFMPPRQAWEDRAALVRREGTQAIVEATLTRWFSPGFLASGQEVIVQVRDTFTGINREGYAACCEAIARMDLRPGLGRITAPTLVVAGEQDPATPVEMSEALRTAISGAVMQVLDPAAHLLATEQPSRCANLLADFVLGKSSTLGKSARVERAFSQRTARRAGYVCPGRRE